MSVKSCVVPGGLVTRLGTSVLSRTRTANGEHDDYELTDEQYDRAKQLHFEMGYVAREALRLFLLKGRDG